MSSSGRSSFSTRGLSAAQTPTAMPIATASAVATSTCDAVSIAGSQTPMTPIASSISSDRDRRPPAADRNAIAASPAIVTNHGISTSNTRSGSSAYLTRKFPIGSVMPKMNDDGSCT